MFGEAIEVSKSLFSPTVILKAAYNFLDTCYVHIEELPSSWSVSLSPKDGCASENELSKEFENEILAQAVRAIVYERTHNIREMLLARAISSSVIVQDDDDSDGTLVSETDISNDELKGILTSWFDKHEV